MTAVAFHFNAPDRQGYTCRLLRKAYQKGSKVVVLTRPGELAALDQALWTFAQLEFIPHVRMDAAAPLRGRTPVLLTDDATSLGAGGEVLVNLSGELPADYERFDRVIEVVTVEPVDRQHARERWKRYREAGHEPQQHDVAMSRA
jgi:DNA polymerase-3 subunit chi